MATSGEAAACWSGLQQMSSNRFSSNQQKAILAHIGATADAVLDTAAQGFPLLLTFRAFRADEAVKYQRVLPQTKQI